MIYLPVVFKEYIVKRFDLHDHPKRHVNDFILTNNEVSFRPSYSEKSGPILLEFSFKDNNRIKLVKGQLVQTWE